MGAIRRKSFDDSDGLREFPLLKVSLARIGSHTIGRGVVQPRWHWSENLGPVMRAESCPRPSRPGAALRALRGAHGGWRGGGVSAWRRDGHPARDDAWVVGDEPAELIDFAGNIDALGLPVIDEGMRRWYESCSCCLSDAYPDIKAALDAERAAGTEAPVGAGICEVAEAQEVAAP